ncbi:VOC family protein [Roseibium sp. SCPC15]|uniref:VOC family protein n=1 Tax=Roseibium sp. SCP15 TaxID=3141376 RepID=UPI003337287D
MTKARLTALSLKVRDPEKLADFYCNILGMHRIEFDGATAVGFGDPGACLVLEPSNKAGVYHHRQNDRYWKIALTVPDLDIAYTQLSDLGLSVTTPNQFRDIAYMSHLADPEGHVIELIQHSFQGKPLTRAGDPKLPLGGGARIGLITLRTDDIEMELKRCREELGMRYLSRQAVSDRGFDLYFFGLTDDELPEANVNSVENREWLWQRPFTVLEFQHLLNGPVATCSDDAPGAACVLVQQEDGTMTVFG